MSKKKKRPQTRDQDLQKAKAIIRGVRDPEMGMSRLKQSYSPRQLLEIVPKLIRQPAFKAVIANKPFPSDFGSTGTSRYLQTASLEKEVAWLCGLLVSFSKEMGAYLSAVLKYDDQYLNGDKSGCDDTLNSLKNSLGVSISVFERELQSIYYFESYAGKTKLLSAINPIKKNPLIDYAFLWPSIRIDRTLRPEEFTRKIENYLPSDHYVNGLFRVLQGQLYRADEQTTAEILSASIVFPLIDRYEILIEVFIEAISSSSFKIPNSCIESLIILEKNITDTRLQKILVANGVTPSSGSNIQVMSSSTRKIVEISKNAMLGINIAAPEKQEEFKSENEISLLQEIELNLTEVLSFSPKSYPARNTLLNLCSIHRNQSWSGAVRLLLENQVNNVLLFEPNQIQVQSVLRSTVDFPLLAFSFSGDYSKELYLNFFRGNMEHSDMVDVYDGIRLDDLTKSKHLKYPIPSISRHLQNNRVLDARRVLEKSSKDNNLEYKSDVLSVAYVHFLFRAEELKLATTEAAESIMRSSFYSYLLPISEMAHSLSVENYKPISQSLTRGEISTAIIFDVHSRILSTKYDVEKADTYKDVLTINKVNKASELSIISPNYTSSELHYFLKNVCILDVLDQSLIFEKTTDVEDERVAVLVRLNELKQVFNKNDDAEIKEELTDISTRKVVRKTTIQLEKSKIYVNIEGIRRQLGSKLQDTWDRFKASKSSDFEVMNSNIMDHLSNALGLQLQLLVINKPITERNKLLESIIHTIISEFTLNKEFGLNSNLSANIRHGYVLGELRGPFVKNRLVTNKDKDTDSGVYLKNEKLLSNASKLSVEELAYFEERLNKFSARIDEEIENLNKNLLRIRTIDFPKGLFVYDINQIVLEKIMSGAEETDSFTKFSNIVYDLLWTLTELNLNAVRESLENLVSVNLTGAVDELRGDLEKKKIIRRVSDLNTHIVNAKGDIRHSIESVSNWFTLSKVTEYQDYKLQLAYQAGLRTIKTYFIDTEIASSFSGDDPALMGQTLPFFTRLFFLLLDNACSHGAEEGVMLNIDVTCEVEEKFVMLRVKNSLRQGRDKLKVIEVVETINSEYGKSLGLDRIGEESGSGYPKIWNLLRNDLNLDHDLSVSLEDNEFVVEILIEGGKLL